MRQSFFSRFFFFLQLPIAAAATVVASLTLGTLASALTLKEANEDPEAYIFYDTTPYSISYQAGLGSLMAYGSLTLLCAGIAAFANCIGAKRRRRTHSIEALVM